MSCKDWRLSNPLHKACFFDGTLVHDDLVRGSAGRRIREKEKGLAQSRRLSLEESLMAREDFNAFSRQPSANPGT